MKKSLKSACMAAGLATAWNLGHTAEAPAAISFTIPVSLSVDPSTALSNAYFTIFSPGSSSPNLAAVTAVPGTFAAGVTTTVDFNASIPGGFSNVPANNIHDEYGLISIYNGGGLSLGFTPAGATSDTGDQFNTLFTSTTESSLQSSMAGSGNTAVQSFYVTNGNDQIVTQMTNTLDLLNFSGGGAGGTASAYVVLPEPTRAALLGVAAFGMVRRRPRRGTCAL